MNEIEKFKDGMDAFLEKLNKEPNPKVIKTNAGIKYIPVEVIESLLDSLFMGNWEVTDLRYSIEVNAVVVSLNLRVLNPVTGVWLTRAGVGSVPVQMRKGTNEVNPMALQKNFPAAKAFAFKNACQSLGRRFGRNINRNWDIPFHKDTPNFTPLIEKGETND